VLPLIFDACLVAIMKDKDTNSYASDGSEHLFALHPQVSRAPGLGEFITPGQGGPRLEHTPDGEPIGLLQEQQSTQRCLGSTDIMGGEWVGAGVTEAGTETFRGFEWPRLAETATTATHTRQQNILGSMTDPHGVRFFYKPSGRPYLVMRDSGYTGSQHIINTETLEISWNGSGHTTESTVTPVEDGWFEIQFRYAHPNIPNWRFALGFAETYALNQHSYAGDGVSGGTFAFPQVEQNEDGARTSFIASDSVEVVRQEDTYDLGPKNVKNLIPYSDSFATGYVAVGMSAVATDITNHLGDDVATEWKASAGTSRYVYDNIPITSGETYTLSMYVKATTPPGRLRLFFSSAAFPADNRAVLFDLQNGTIVDQTTPIATIDPAGDGWYRVSMTAVATGTSASLPAGFVVETIDADDATTTADSDGTERVAVWGLQCQTGIKATSLINTDGAAVTETLPSAKFWQPGKPFTMLLRVEPRDLQGSSRIFTALKNGSPKFVVHYTTALNGLQWWTGSSYGPQTVHGTADVSARDQLVIAFRIADGDIFYATQQTGGVVSSKSSNAAHAIDFDTVHIGSGQGIEAHSSILREAIYFDEPLSDDEILQLVEDQNL